MSDRVDQGVPLADDAARLYTWAFSDEASMVATGEAAPSADIYASIQRIAQAADHDRDDELRSAGITHLFRDLVEACNDRLDEDGRNAYAAFFPLIVWEVVKRHERLRQRFESFGLATITECIKRYHGQRQRTKSGFVSLPDLVDKVVVLSRVTIGADVLLTSILCQRLHQAFPAAEIIVLGDNKLRGLLGGLPQVTVESLKYTRRGALGSRLDSWLTVLDELVSIEPDLVISPDSRLDQLGIMPLMEGELSYLLWENTQSNTSDPKSLGYLLDQWAVRVLALEDDRFCPPRVAFDSHYEQQAQQWTSTFEGQKDQRPLLAVKFDHGGNPDKALPKSTEIALLQLALVHGWRIILDAGFGEDELTNSEFLAAKCSQNVTHITEKVFQKDSSIMSESWDILRFEGSIAGWAALLSACHAAVSYDSVGHHLAGALEIPLLSLFTGHHDDMFPIAWAPQGGGAIQQVVIPTAQRDEPQWEEHCLEALTQLLEANRF